VIELEACESRFFEEDSERQTQSILIAASVVQKLVGLTGFVSLFLPKTLCYHQRD
jgi:hypothetical protein